MVKFSIYLNRRVFVMWYCVLTCYFRGLDAVDRLPLFCTRKTNFVTYCLSSDSQFPSEKRSNLKGKTLESKFVPFRVDPFSEGWQTIFLTQLPPRDRESIFCPKSWVLTVIFWLERHGDCHNTDTNCNKTYRPQRPKWNLYVLYIQRMR